LTKIITVTIKVNQAEGGSLQCLEFEQVMWRRHLLRSLRQLYINFYLRR